MSYDFPLDAVLLTPVHINDQQMATESTGELAATSETTVPPSDNENNSEATSGENSANVTPRAAAPPPAAAATALQQDGSTPLQQQMSLQMYMCPLYGNRERHFSLHQSALLDYVFLSSEVDSATLMKRGAMLAINA